MSERFSMITRFLLFSSGATLELIKKCPRFEVNKHASIGLTIVFTAILSVLSSYFAFKLIFKSDYLAISLAFLWGGIIFNLDRFIVSSMRVNDSKVKGFMKSIPRLLIAILIAMVISKPLEIQLFKSEISTFLSQEKIKQSDNIRQKYIPDFQRIEGKKEALRASFQEKLLLRDKYYEEYKCECTGTCGTKIKGYGKECRSRKERYELFLLELDEDKQKMDAIMKQYDIEKKSVQELVEKEEAILLVNSYGLFDQIRALNQIDKFSSFFIFFIFIMIETAPIFTKLLSEKGPYDNLVLEYEIQFEASYLKQLDTHKHERLRNKKLIEMSTNVELKSKESEIRNRIKEEAVARYDKLRQAIDNKNFKA